MEAAYFLDLDQRGLHLDALDVLKWLYRNQGMHQLDKEAVRRVHMALQLRFGEFGEGGPEPCEKLLELWCFARGWDHKEMAREFLDYVDDLNREDETWLELDVWALQMEPTHQRWVQVARWQVAEQNTDGEYNGLSSDEVEQKLEAAGVTFSVGEWVQKSIQFEALEEAQQIATDPICQGVLQALLKAAWKAPTSAACAAGPHRPRASRAPRRLRQNDSPQSHE